jgi:hypothetical protein
LECRADRISTKRSPHGSPDRASETPPLTLNGLFVGIKEEPENWAISMKAVQVAIERFVDEYHPGIVECRLVLVEKPRL